MHDVQCIKLIHYELLLSDIIGTIIDILPAVCASSTGFSSLAVQFTVCVLLLRIFSAVNNRIEGGQNGYG